MTMQIFQTLFLHDVLSALEISGNLVFKVFDSNLTLNFVYLDMVFICFWNYKIKVVVSS